MQVIAQFSGRYQFLSNFYEESDGKTNEHRFQASKATCDEDRDFVMNQRGPYMAKQAGRRILLRPDWEAVRIDVMSALLIEKFNNTSLRSKLLETGEATLIEGNNHRDDFWGATTKKDEDLPLWSTSWYGHNHLGKLLMHVRTIYHNIETGRRL